MYASLHLRDRPEQRCEELPTETEKQASTSEQADALEKNKKVEAPQHCSKAAGRRFFGVLLATMRSGIEAGFRSLWLDQGVDLDCCRDREVRNQDPETQV